MARERLQGVAAANGADTMTCQCGCNAPDPTGMRSLLIALNVARLAAYKVTAIGAWDIVEQLNDLIAGVEELQRQ